MILIIFLNFQLKINYSDYHLLQLENKGFTDEEINFNKLVHEIHMAKKRLKSNIKKMKDILSIYEVTSKEMEELIHRKINI
jgi:hypothetical protein